MKKYLDFTLRLASQYNIEPEVVAYIRSCCFDLKLDRKQMLERQTNKISQIKKQEVYNLNAIKRHQLVNNQEKVMHLQEQIDRMPKNISKRMAIYNFLLSINDDNYKELTAKYE